MSYGFLVVLDTLPKLNAVTNGTNISGGSSGNIQRHVVAGLYWFYHEELSSLPSLTSFI